MYTKLNPKDFDQISFLKKKLRPFYNEQILTWQYYRWQNLNSCLYLLKQNDVYIASQGMIPIHLTSGKKSRLTAKSETSYLLPDFRGKGMFEDLYSYNINKSEKDKVELIWGFTALSKVWRKKLNFSVYDGLITETELQLSPRIAMKSLWSEKMPIWNRFKQSLKILLRTLRNKKTPPISLKINAKEIDLSNQQNMDDIQSAFENWKTNYSSNISIDLTTDFLEWRLFRNPILKYKVIGLYEDSKLYGFAVINTTSVYSYLLELIIDEPTKIREGVYSLLKYWRRLKNSSHINYWASNRNIYSNEIINVLYDLGAKKMINNNMNFVCKKTKHNSFETDDISSFYINGLWTEGFTI